MEENENYEKYLVRFVLVLAILLCILLGVVSIELMFKYFSK